MKNFEKLFLSTPFWKFSFEKDEKFYNISSREFTLEEILFWHQMHKEIELNIINFKLLFKLNWMQILIQEKNLIQKKKYEFVELSW